MPGKRKEKPLKGVGSKEERMYEHIKDSAKKTVATATAPKKLRLAPS